MSGLAAAYLANHTKLMLVPLKKTNPGDYDYRGRGDFLLSVCLSECLIINM